MTLLNRPTSASWDSFWDDYLTWASESVLGNQEPRSMVAKFAEESGEFLSEPSIDEAIDCMAVLMFWALQTGVLPETIAARAFERLEVWKQRTWERSENGSYHHVAPADKAGTE